MLERSELTQPSAGSDDTSAPANSLAKKARIGRGRDHGGVVGGELARGKQHRHAFFSSASLKRASQFAVGGDPAGDEQGRDAVFGRRRQCLADEIVNDGALK